MIPSTTQYLCNEILQKLEHTSIHEYNCTCGLCELKTIIKNIRDETPSIPPESHKNDNKINDNDNDNNNPAYKIYHLNDFKKDIEFELVDNQNEIIRNRLKSLLIECAFCGPQSIKATSKDCENEYFLDCGHHIYVGEERYIKSKSASDSHELNHTS